jgi:hypothetical protein
MGGGGGTLAASFACGSVTDLAWAMVVIVVFCAYINTIISKFFACLS